ncbi:hypothetical protein STEG23_007402 [Scotinomys teguina]
MVILYRGTSIHDGITPHKSILRWKHRLYLASYESESPENQTEKERWRSLRALCRCEELHGQAPSAKQLYAVGMTSSKFSGNDLRSWSKSRKLIQENLDFGDESVGSAVLDGVKVMMSYIWQHFPYREEKSLGRNGCLKKLLSLRTQDH